jgi:6-hydroxy-3-succinoylpyridine 3-monooxygenase
VGGLYDRPLFLASDPPPPAPKPRAVVYIDGFNFYYGAVKGTPYKWLNFQELCRRLLKDDEIVSICYFTARVSGTYKQARQMALWQALATLPLVTIIPGHFKSKSVECTHAECVFAGDRHFSTFEEKHTDVNIAIHMLDDAYQNRCDRLILFSGDSDLVPAIKLVRKRFPDKKVVVYAPTGAMDETGAPIKDRRADELKQCANDGRDLPVVLLSLCQFPVEVPDSKGHIIKKPTAW